MKLQSVSTLGMALQSRQSVSENQRQLLSLQQEQATGKKHDVSGALGAQTAYVMRLREEYSSAESYVTNNKTVSGRLEIMQTALSGLTTAGNELLTKVAAALSGESAKALVADAARDFILNMESALNSAFGGRSLFGGTVTDAPPLQQSGAVNPGSGFSPMQILQNVIAAKPPVVDAATLTDLLSGPDGIASIFDDTNTTVNYRYQSTFYNGNTQLVTAKVSAETQISYNVTAADPGVRDLLRMAYTLAAVDPSSMPDAQYNTLLDSAIKDLAQGLSEVQHAQAVLGFAEQKLNSANDKHTLTQNILTTYINSLEGADPYETAVRLNSMTTQLEATFSITARISKLSIIDFL